MKTIVFIVGIFACFLSCHVSISHATHKRFFSPYTPKGPCRQSFESAKKECLHLHATWGNAIMKLMEDFDLEAFYDVVTPLFPEKDDIDVSWAATYHNLAELTNRKTGFGSSVIETVMEQHGGPVKYIIPIYSDQAEFTCNGNTATTKFAAILDGDKYRESDVWFAHWGFRNGKWRLVESHSMGGHIKWYNKPDFIEPKKSGLPDSVLSEKDNETRRRRLFNNNNRGFFVPLTPSFPSLKTIRIPSGKETNKNCAQSFEKAKEVCWGLPVKMVKAYVQLMIDFDINKFNNVIRDLISEDIYAYDNYGGEFVGSDDMLTRNGQYVINSLKNNLSNGKPLQYAIPIFSNFPDFECEGKRASIEYGVLLDANGFSTSDLVHAECTFENGEWKLSEYETIQGHVKFENKQDISVDSLSH
jgi:hypothetical protein